MAIGGGVSRAFGVRAGDQHRADDAGAREELVGQRGSADRVLVDVAHHAAAGVADGARIAHGAVKRAFRGDEEVAEDNVRGCALGTSAGGRDVLANRHLGNARRGGFGGGAGASGDEEAGVGLHGVG